MHNTGTDLLPRRLVSLVEYFVAKMMNPAMTHIYKGKINCSPVFQRALNPLKKQFLIPKSRLTQAMNVFKNTSTKLGFS